MVEASTVARSAASTTKSEPIIACLRHPDVSGPDITIFTPWDEVSERKALWWAS